MPNETSSVVLPEEIDKLLRSVIETSFDCGEWASDEDEPYETVSEKNAIAEADLRSSIAKHIQEAKDERDKARQWYENAELQRAVLASQNAKLVEERDEANKKLRRFVRSTDAGCEPDPDDTPEETLESALIEWEVANEGWDRAREAIRNDPNWPKNSWPSKYDCMLIAAAQSRVTALEEGLRKLEYAHRDKAWRGELEDGRMSPRQLRVIGLPDDFYSKLLTPSTADGEKA